MRERFFESISILRDVISNKAFYSRFPDKSRQVLKMLLEELDKILAGRNTVTEGYLLDRDSDFANQYRERYQESVRKMLKVIPILYRSGCMVAADGNSLNKIYSIYDNLKNFDESFQITMYSLYRLD